MKGMFYGCSSLTYLNLSNFNTSLVANMDSMFYYCSSLTELDLSYFDTSTVIKMGGMFGECSSLISLNLSNFITSSITEMDYMFDGCTSLTFLDLSNFDTSSITTMDSIFSNCLNLEYVNLKLAKPNQEITFSTLFISRLVKITICSENEGWKDLFDLSDIQYLNCIGDIYFNDNENKIKCFKKNNELNNLCQICGKNYFNITKINDNIAQINCYENKEGYYFDYDILDYKPCYSSCKKCNISGNETEHNCIECKDEYKREFKLSNYKNCFIDINTELDTEIIIGKEIEINKRTELIQSMIHNLFSQLNISNIDNGNDRKIVDKAISIIITSTKNQKNNENKRMITINLGKCENILKDIYNISKDDSLYMLQIISEEEKGMKIPKIEYEVYYPSYNNNNLAKLNLSLCEGEKIDISII